MRVSSLGCETLRQGRVSGMLLQSPLPGRCEEGRLRLALAHSLLRVVREQSVGYIALEASTEQLHI